MEEKNTSRKYYAAIGALLCWLALALQFYLSLKNRIVGAPMAILRYFSYFTILTNIMVALSYTAVWLYPNGGRLKGLVRPASLTAVTVYIVVVGIIFNTLLQNVRPLGGLLLLVDTTLHAVMPLSFLLFWIFFVPKKGLKWIDAVRWLWYPVSYVIYVIILGALTGFYPYPFADAGQLGYPRALLNGVLITAGFFLLSMMLVGIGRIIRSAGSSPG